MQLCTARPVRGFPSALKCTSLTQLKRHAKATLRNIKTRTSLCCLWKFLQLSQVRVETLPSSYAMAKIVSVPCSIFYLQGFSTIQGNDSLCRNYLSRDIHHDFDTGKVFFSHLYWSTPSLIKHMTGKQIKLRSTVALPTLRYRRYLHPDVCHSQKPNSCYYGLSPLRILSNLLSPINLQEWFWWKGNLLKYHTSKLGILYM